MKTCVSYFNFQPAIKHLSTVVQYKCNVLSKKEKCHVHMRPCWVKFGHVTWCWTSDREADKMVRNNMTCAKNSDTNVKGLKFRQGHAHQWLSEKDTVIKQQKSIFCSHGKETFHSETTVKKKPAFICQFREWCYFRTSPPRFCFFRV